MIEFRNVQAGRPGVTLFRDFNWRIEAGENWVLRGGNGSGKTLLLELLSGKMHPSGGGRESDIGNPFSVRRNVRKPVVILVERELFGR